MNLFEDMPCAYDKAEEWSRREEEFVKRVGFVLMARLAVSDKKSANENFIAFFPMIKEGALDKRNFAKKAVNWALRQIGKRDLSLNRRAIGLAEELQQTDSISQVGGSRCHKGAYWRKSAAEVAVQKGKVSFVFTHASMHPAVSSGQLSMQGKLHPQHPSVCQIQYPV